MGIDGLGITKSAHITWSVSNTLTPTSRFADYADALESACQALIGINLPALDPITGGNALSGEMINGADCEAVAAIIAVTELRTPPDQCQILDPVAPPLCESEVGQPSVMFVEDWESGVLPEGWTVGRRDVANVENFNAPDWSVTDALPAPGTGNYAAYGANLNDCGETGVTWLRSPPIQSDSDKPFVAIDHMFSIEYGYDGGNVKVIVNGESPMLVNDFAFNPYNDTILTAAGTSNPMSSEPAFTGSNPPASTPYWAQSQLSLEGLASAGDSVEFLFEMGTDECFGYDGWYIDRLQVYNCDSACGDAQLTGNEQCDDGNAESGDGCSATCQIEPGYTCTDPVPPVLTNLLQDPGFEDGPPHDAWNPSSSNFGTPLCDLDSCGYDGARTGSWFLWFGGYSGGEEEGSVSQTLVIPDTATELRLYKRLAVCDSGTDFAELLIDGNQLMVQSGDDPDCGESDYVPVTIDISAYADNAEHTITLHSVTYSVNGGPTNVFFDDLSLPQGPLDATPGMCQSIDLFKDGFEDPPP